MQHVHDVLINVGWISYSGFGMIAQDAIERGSHVAVRMIMVDFSRTSIGYTDVKESSHACTREPYSVDSYRGYP
jgi:hypothetical protein